MPELFTLERLRTLFALIVNGLVQVVAMAGVAFLISAMMDGITSGANSEFGLIVGGMLCANLALGLLKWHEMIAAQRLGESYSMDMRRNAFRHLSTLSVHAQANLRGGSVQLRFVNDLTAIRNWISNGLARLIISATISIGTIAALWWIDPKLASVLFVMVIVASVGALAIGKSFDDKIRLARKRRGQIAANISEKIINMPVIQAFAHLDAERGKLKKQSRRLADAQIDKAAVTGVFRGFMTFVIGSGIALMVLAVSWNAGPSGPEIGPLVSAIGLFSLLSPNLMRLGRVYEYWKTARIAQEKLARLFALGPSIEPATEPKRPQERFESVVLDNVSVAPVLRGVTCEIRPNDRIVLKGGNGAGKTTMLNLILRLIEPDSGTVCLSGTDIRSIRTGELRRQISIVSPTLGMMKGTVASNIAYGSSKADDGAVLRAANQCAMDPENPESPFFLKRRVREGGRNLSAGERMRISLARAMASSPQVLLLDEPESHLDAGSLKVLIELLETYEGAWLATSHTQALDSIANRHWTLKQGQLSESREVLAA